MKKIFYLLFLISLSNYTADCKMGDSFIKDQVKYWNETFFLKLADEKKGQVTLLIFYWIKLNFFKLKSEEFEKLRREINFESWKEEEKSAFLYFRKNMEVIAACSLYGRTTHLEFLEGSNEEIASQLKSLRQIHMKKNFKVCMAFYSKAYKYLNDHAIKMNDKNVIGPKEFELISTHFA